MKFTVNILIGIIIQTSTILAINTQIYDDYFLCTQSRTITASGGGEFSWTLLGDLDEEYSDSTSIIVCSSSREEAHGMAYAYDIHGNLCEAWNVYAFSLEFITPKQLSANSTIEYSNKIKSGEGKNMIVFGETERHAPLPAEIEIKIKATISFPNEKRLSDYMNISDISIYVDDLESGKPANLKTDTNITFVDEGNHIGATYVYNTLPCKNSSFGIKNIVIGSYNFEINRTRFKLFYERAIRACVGGYSNIGVRSYYFAQTKAGNVRNDYLRFRYDSEVSGTDYTKSPYIYYVGCLNTSETIPYGANARDTLSSIDLYAWAMRHEKQHHLNYTQWWGSAYDEALDADTDRIPNVIESQIPTSLSGQAFYPNNSHSHTDPKYENNNDDEVYTCLKAEVWRVGSANHEDWSKPGKQYD